jgi:periplasmic divalent cation tolerance protein
MSEARVVLSTIGSSDDAARRIARKLVEERLAACVNMMPIESCYSWKGKLVEDVEVLLVIKTTAARLAELERRLHEIHPYTVPEFVVIDPGHVAEPYLSWLTQTVKPPWP